MVISLQRLFMQSRRLDSSWQVIIILHASEEESIIHFIKR
uniref:Uncharacterized protein n=1 Tax=Arundo donax TaxID=35708 RepID=A0A0A9G1G2_ARUDO